jgi:hypothetical protein
MKTTRIIVLAAGMCIASNLRAEGPHSGHSGNEGATWGEIAQTPAAYSESQMGARIFMMREIGQAMRAGDTARAGELQAQIDRNPRLFGPNPTAAAPSPPAPARQSGAIPSRRPGTAVDRPRVSGNTAVDAQPRSASTVATPPNATTVATPPAEPVEPSPGSAPRSPANPPSQEGPVNAPEPALGGESRSVRNFRNVLGALGVTSAAFEGAAQEGQRAMQAGEAPSRLRAARNGLAEATTIPGILRGVEYGGNLRDKHVAEAERYHGNGLDAQLTGRAMALREFVFDLTGLNSGSRIAQEEILNEVRQAAREGREPDFRRSTLHGMVRGLGEVLLINTIARSANSVTEEEVNYQGQQQVLRSWVQRKANEILKEMNSVKAALRQMASHGNPDDPNFRQQLIDLSRRYDKARTAMTNLSDAAGRQLGDDDPLTRSVRNRVASLPGMPSEEEIRRFLPPGESTATTDSPPGAGSEDPPSDGPGQDDEPGSESADDMPDDPEDEPVDPPHAQPDDSNEDDPQMDDSNGHDPDDPECDCPEMESDDSESGDMPADANDDA